MKAGKLISTIAAVGLGCALFIAAGCSSSGSSSSSSTASGTSSQTTATAQTETTKTVTLHRGYAAAHGTKCFTQVVVATAEDGTILAVNVDDYQFVAKDSAGATGVPNSDKKFGDNIINNMMLISKTDNNAFYSAMMKEEAQATQEWLVSIKAIEDYAVGKKATDLSSSTAADAISGATLKDKAKYLAAIATVAADNSLTTKGTYTGDGSDLKIGRTMAAAHGESAVCNAVSLVQNGTIVATSIDEFQFMDATASGLKPVPNSDADFGANYAEGKALASKSINSAIYSANMKEKAQATTAWIDSMDAIENTIAGKTFSDASAINGPDAVSGATLEDTAGYVQAAVTAAKAAA